MSTHSIGFRLSRILLLTIGLLAFANSYAERGGYGYHGGGVYRGGGYYHGGGGYYHGGGYYRGGGGYYRGGGWGAPGVVVGVPLGGYYSGCVNRCYSNGNCVRTCN